MATNPKIKITSKQGTVKKCQAKDITRDMTSDSIWHNSAASTVNTPYTFDNSHLDWIIWERTEWLKIEFTPDDTASDGQGYASVPSGPELKVDSVTGTVFIIRAQFINLADEAEKIYVNTNRQSASVGDTLYPGDAILCAKSGALFTLKMTAPEYGPYTAQPIVLLGLE